MAGASGRGGKTRSRKPHYGLRIPWRLTQHWIWDQILINTLETNFGIILNFKLWWMKFTSYHTNTHKIKTKSRKPCKLVSCILVKIFVKNIPSLVRPNIPERIFCPFLGGRAVCRSWLVTRCLNIQTTWFLNFLFYFLAAPAALYPPFRLIVYCELCALQTEPTWATYLTYLTDLPNWPSPFL